MKRAVARVAVVLALGMVVPAAAHSAGRLAFDAAVADAKAAMLIDPRQALNKARAAQAMVRALPPEARSAAIATTEWLQAEADVRLNDDTAAAPMILDAMRRAPARSKLRGDLLLARGGLNTSRTRVADALADYQQAHDLFRDIGETRSQAIALLSIASLYQNAKDYRRALPFYEQAMEAYHGDPSLQLSIHNNRGNALTELARYPEAEAEFGRALALARSMKSLSSQARILRNVARSQLSAGRLEQADRTIAQAVSVGARAAVPNDGQDEALGARLALLRGDLGRARDLIARTFAGLDLGSTPLAYREAHQTAFEVYRRLGDTSLALVHLEAIKRLDDNTGALAASANTALAAARFDYANQETRIANLKAVEAQRSADNERARAAMERQIFLGSAAVALAVLALLSFGLVTIRRSRNEVRAANIDLGASNVALAKALAAKTEFLATTSHEIRTPLNGILGMTQVMLADRALPPPLRDRLGVVHGAGTAMKALVDDILDVAKMETGNLTIEQAPVDLPALVRDVSRLWEEQARGRGLDFVLDVADAPAWISGDAARLRQILFNLLSNALKFTERGGVTLRVAHCADRLAIAVRDSGIGIPAAKQELIFESFKQADGGTTRKYGGTGLGLAICRNLARAMDGDILIESRDGEGATFTLDMPLVRLAPPAPPPRCSPGSDTPCGLLIVDRSPITRNMLKTVLESRTAAVRFAGSVDEAVAQIGEGHLSHVLIDEATITAAGDVAAALRRVTQAGGAVHVAQLWTAPSDAWRAALLDAGADQVIAKPITGTALAEALFPAGENSAAEHLVTQAA